jgi:hypothetical protein
MSAEHRGRGAIFERFQHLLVARRCGAPLMRAGRAARMSPLTVFGRPNGLAIGDGDEVGVRRGGLQRTLRRIHTLESTRVTGCTIQTIQTHV